MIKPEVIDALMALIESIENGTLYPVKTTWTSSPGGREQNIHIFRMELVESLPPTIGHYIPDGNP